MTQSRKNSPICGVYIITNNINLKYYIGKSINIKRRWNQHKYGNTKIPFANAIKKYGIENFSFKILEEIEYIKYKKEEMETKLVELEQKWIDEKKPYLKKNGYNILPTSKYNKTDLRSEDFRKKISRIKIEMNHGGKAINQYNEDGSFIRKWRSAAEIERELGIKAENISSVCLKKSKKCRNYIWRFENDVLTTDEINKINFICRKRKKILKMDKDFNPLMIFDSIIDAAKSVGSNDSSPLTHICHGRGETYKGFRWKYVD